MMIINLPIKEFKVKVIKMFTKLRRRMGEHSENFNKEKENIRKCQTVVIELQNIITELKNTLDSFNSRFDEAGKQISKLEDKARKLT